MDSEALGKLYRRASAYYDILDWPFEHFRYKALRRSLWHGLQGRLLDLGAGTGRNAPFYPASARVATADLSPEMLRRAEQRIRACGRTPEIVVADVLNLGFREGEFDAVVSTFLFCVLPDELQVQALREVRRVLRPGGRVHLLEYVYSQRPLRRLLMKTLAPMVEGLYGARFDRRTAEHLETAGFRIVERSFVHDDVLLYLCAEA